MLGEINESQKRQILTCNVSEVVKFVEVESRVVVNWDREGGRGVVV